MNDDVFLQGISPRLRDDVFLHHVKVFAVYILLFTAAINTNKVRQLFFFFLETKHHTHTHTHTHTLSNLQLWYRLLKSFPNCFQYVLSVLRFTYPTVFQGYVVFPSWSDCLNKHWMFLVYDRVFVSLQMANASGRNCSHYPQHKRLCESGLQKLHQVRSNGRESNGFVCLFTGFSSCCHSVKLSSLGSSGVGLKMGRKEADISSRGFLWICSEPREVACSKAQEQFWFLFWWEVVKTVQIFAVNCKIVKTCWYINGLSVSCLIFWQNTLFCRETVITWLPAAALYVISIYSGSVALANLVRPPMFKPKLSNRFGIFSFQRHPNP